jgi:hypothetical protein
VVLTELLCRFVRVMRRVKVVAVCYMSVMRSFCMIAVRVVLRSFMMVFCCVLVMLGRLLVVIRNSMRFHSILLVVSHNEQKRCRSKRLAHHGARL